MTDSTDNALKPCPFCGGEAAYARAARGWKVECAGRFGTCTINARTHYQPHKFMAVNAWNTRADLAPDPQDARVKVKPLKWDGAGDRLSASAFGLSIAYRITGKPSDWTLMKTGATRYIHEEGFETQKAAKAAAQSDYTARILSALAPTPQAARVTALVEALREITTCVEDGCYCSEMKMAAAVDEARAALAAFDKGDENE